METRKVKMKCQSHTANVELYNSANELVDTCLKRTYKGGSFHGDTFSGSRDKGGRKWNGGLTAKQSLETLANGWSENVEKLTKKMNSVKQLADGKRNTFRNDVVGYSPIVPLAIMGVPTSMISSTQKKIKSKIIDIYYDTTVSCGNSAKQILDNGMKLMETVVNLENSGYRVRLSAMQSYSVSDSSDILIVRVKNENQPLDIKRVMFPIMHPAMFRVIGFGWYERCPTAEYRNGYGRGLSYNMSEKEFDIFVKELFGKSACALSGKFIQDKSQEYIEKTLKGEYIK